VTLVFGFLLLPVVVVALASVSRTSYLTVPPQGVTLRWFGAVLADPEYVHAIVWAWGSPCGDHPPSRRAWRRPALIRRVRGARSSRLERAPSPASWWAWRSAVLRARG
jgi:hypothetical protein